MGHFTKKIIDYNPLTDVNTYGPLEYVEDENDKNARREEYEKRQKKIKLKL